MQTWADILTHISLMHLKAIFIFPPYEIVKTADGQMAGLISMHLEI